MKITWKHGDRSIEFECKPIPAGRFRALCKLAWGIIGGAALLAAVRMVGLSAIVAAVVALALAGLYRIIPKFDD